MDSERIIKILEYLGSHTDEKHYASVKDIKEHIENECGFERVSVLTVRRDIERLISCGYDISEKNGAHNTRYYSYCRKGFTFNEIRFLVDSISINKFLSNPQKQRIFRKFEGMCSEHEIRNLISRIQLSDIAPPDLNLLDNLEKIHAVISEKCMIDFDYGKFDTHKQMKYYSKKRRMIPGKVIYFNEHFYLKCMDEESGRLRTYRIDRMKNIRSGQKTRKKVNIPKYDGAVLDIFEPDYFATVKFKVKRFLLDDMIEQFGRYASEYDIPDDSENVIVSVKVGISQSFCRWVMRYGENIEIISPENIRNEFKENLKKMAEIYGLPEIIAENGDER